jgi:two-component sensor histidine kinase/PAS domain-containing protein
MISGSSVHIGGSPVLSSGASKRFDLAAAIVAARQRPWLAYAVAIGAVLVAVAVRVSLSGVLQHHIPFFTFFPALFVAAVFGGILPGLLALAACALAGWSFLPASSIGGVEQAAFASTGLLCVLAGALMNRLSYAAFVAAQRADEVALDFKKGEQRAQADLQAMKTVYDVSVSCISSHANLDANLRSILDAAISVTGAVKGNIQLVDPASQTLTIAAHRGFAELFLKFFDGVSASACAVARRRRERVIVDDVTTSPIFAGEQSLNVLLEADVRAVQSTPLVDRMGSVIGMISTHYDVPHRPTDRELRFMDLLAAIASGYLESENLRHLLGDRTLELNALLDIIPMPVFIASDPECRMIRGNRAACALYQVPQETNWSQTAVQLGEKALRIQHYRHGRQIAPEDMPIQRAALTGETQHEPQIDLEFADGSRVTISGETVPIRDGSGQIRGVIGAFADVTELRKNQQQLQTLAEDRFALIQELNHRVKNTLAIVQSVAEQTLRDGDNADALGLLEGRLHSLSKAHNILSESNWQGGLLKELVVRSLSPFPASRMKLEGAEVTLPPNHVVKLSMSLFELGTNAVKYGAWSNGEGEVELTWCAAGPSGKDLQLKWTERAGPLVTPPKRKGFGSQMLERVLSHDLRASTSIEYRAEGIVAVVTIPNAWRTARPNESSEGSPLLSRSQLPAAAAILDSRLVR